MAKKTIDKRKQASLEAKAAVIKAIAHPTRLFIVEELAQGDKCVCEITDMLAVDTSTVSKHLSVLKNAGVLEDEKRGLMVYYHLSMPCILKFIGCIESALKQRVKAQLELVK
ncbi:ArsR/SmtB family transcription factor [Fibrobacterota bacterium]